MFQLAKFTAAAAAVLLSGTAFAATSLTDGSFETQGAASTTDYCYFDIATPGGPACATGAWIGAGAGIQAEANSAWPGAPTPDGSYYGFVQGLGILGQLFTADTGTYTLSWLDAGRPAGVAGGDQSYEVLLQADGGAATVLATYSTTTGQGFAARSLGGIALQSGVNYAIAFRGTNPNGGDNTAFIDSVALAAVPEPATWAMMIGGIGALGGSLRTRRRALRLA